MTYPAPIFLSYDEWFGEPILTETQMEYQKLMKEFCDDIILNMDCDIVGSWKTENEPDNIHEVMYDMATRSQSTTLHLNPIGGSENFQGGSENFQGGSENVCK